MRIVLAFDRQAWLSISEGTTKRHLTEPYPHKVNWESTDFLRFGVNQVSGGNCEVMSPVLPRMCRESISLAATFAGSFDTCTEGHVTSATRQLACG